MPFEDEASGGSYASSSKDDMACCRYRKCLRHHHPSTRDCQSLDTDLSHVTALSGRVETSARSAALGIGPRPIISTRFDIATTKTPPSTYYTVNPSSATLTSSRDQDLLIIHTKDRQRTSSQAPYIPGKHQSRSYNGRQIRLARLVWE